MSDVGDLRARIGRGRRLPRPSRRDLLVAGGAGAGLGLAWLLWPRGGSVTIGAMPGEQVFGAFLKIAPDGRVTVLVPQAELGQGAYTLIAQIAADELGADWRTVAVEPAPISAAYVNQLLLDEDAALATPRMAVPEAFADLGGWKRLRLASSSPAMLTGNSTTQRQFEGPVRDCAAAARAMLCMAAADRWDADWLECEAVGGFVSWQRRRLRFGELVGEAATYRPPSTPPLRAMGSGPLAGRPLPRLDLPAKIDGSINFAADVRLPGMVFAAIRQGPHGHTRLARHDRRAAEAVSGFLAAVRHERWLAAVATNSWAAQRALDAMAPRFATTGDMADSSVADRRLKAAFADGGTRMLDEGDVESAMDGRQVFSADYAIAPSLHQAIEPRAATAAPDNGRMRLWVASQAPALCRAAVATALGLAESAVTLLPMPAGGSFDAAMEHDVAVQAALIAKAMNRPVQLSWGRTEEILRDSPRAAARVRVSGTLSSGATIDALRVSVAAPAARHQWRDRLTGDSGDMARRNHRATIDAAMVEGAASPYLIPNRAVNHFPVDTLLPAGKLRGDAAGFNVFAVECFVDELARAAEVDPFVFRMGMLGNEPLLARCLETVTALGGWDGGGPGSGLGIACASRRGSHIAVLAEAREGASGIQLRRLHVAVDVGRAMNPTLVMQQIEGGLVFGIAAATGATTRYRQGLAQARHMGNLNLPRLGQIPEITVELLPSERPAGGYGEIGMLAVAPAIANALFSVTGTRLRRLPLSRKPLV